MKSCGRVMFVPIPSVDWIAAEGDYVRLHTRDRSYLINDSLTSLDARLAPSMFARIHRSTIVNLGCVDEVRACQGHDHILRLSSGIELRLSRTYYRQFLHHIR